MYSRSGQRGNCSGCPVKSCPLGWQRHFEYGDRQLPAGAEGLILQLPSSIGIVPSTRSLPSLGPLGPVQALRIATDLLCLFDSGNRILIPLS